MWTKLQHKGLYLLVLIMGLFLCLTALGGGLFGQSENWFLQWQQKAFAGLCHQDPQRSFWLNGSPMAVCTRCLGLYWGFTITWLLLPVVSSQIKKIGKKDKKILIGIVLLNVLDVVGNFLGYWQNTLVSRFIFGLFLSIAVVTVINSCFEKDQTTNTKEYGIVK